MVRRSYLRCLSADALFRVGLDLYLDWFLMRGIVAGYLDRVLSRTLLRRREGDRHHSARVSLNCYRTTSGFGQGRTVARRTHLHSQRT